MDFSQNYKSLKSFLFTINPINLWVKCTKLATYANKKGARVNLCQ